MTQVENGQFHNKEDAMTPEEINALTTLGYVAGFCVLAAAAWFLANRKRGPGGY